MRFDITIVAIGIAILWLVAPFLSRLSLRQQLGKSLNRAAAAWGPVAAGVRSSRPGPR
jgi:hypothetical protein